jgi:hypothetical protein
VHGRALTDKCDECPNQPLRVHETPEQAVEALKEAAREVLECFKDYSEGKLGRLVVQVHMDSLEQTLDELDASETYEQEHIHDFQGEGSL